MLDLQPTYSKTIFPFLLIFCDSLSIHQFCQKILSYYCQKRKVLEMLTDDSYYQPVLGNKRREIFGKIDDLIKSNKKFDCKTSTFYGLSIIHKSKFIQDICIEL